MFFNLPGADWSLNVTDQVSVQTSTDSVAPEAIATTKNEQAPDASSFDKQLQILKAELAEARKEAARYRKRNDDETQAKLKEQGDFKSLYEQAAPQLEKAKRYEAWAEKQQARIETEVSTLPAYLQKAIAIAPDVESKLELLDEYKAEVAKVAPTQTKQPSQPPPSGVPAGAPAAEINLLSMTDRELTDFKRTNPERFMQAISKLAVKSAPVPSTASWSSRKK